MPSKYVDIVCDAAAIGSESSHVRHAIHDIESVLVFLVEHDQTIGLERSAIGDRHARHPRNEIRWVAGHDFQPSRSRSLANHKTNDLFKLQGLAKPVITGTGTHVNPCQVVEIDILGVSRRNNTPPVLPCPIGLLWANAVADLSGENRLADCERRDFAVIQRVLNRAGER